MPDENLATFISYSRADAEFADKLARDLRSAGASIWMDRSDIRPAQRWYEAIQNALVACARLVVVLSPDALVSPNVTDEALYAQQKNKQVIPILYRSCEIPYWLYSVEYVDLRADYEPGLTRLLYVLGVGNAAAENAVRKRIEEQAGRGRISGALAARTLSALEPKTEASPTASHGRETQQDRVRAPVEDRTSVTGSRARAPASQSDKSKPVDKPMNPKIVALANLMRGKSKEGTGFALMLGAGASLSSGVMPAADVMREVLQQYGADLTGGDVEQRFHQLWSRSSAETRAAFLAGYLKPPARPSFGYHRVAELIAAGCFDVIITFNYDNLLEKALQEAGFRDFAVIVRGDHPDDEVVRLVHSKEPRVKILKLHSSLTRSESFLFAREEMFQYPREISSLVEELTRRDIVICGYDFKDVCVMRAFSIVGGSLCVVNPAGATPPLKGILAHRRSNDWVIDGEDGEFDQFFELLHRQFIVSPHPPSGRQNNLFHFLGGYEIQDQDHFVGRRALARKVLAVIEQRPATPVHLTGQQGVGKTSFVRAGLLPGLASDRFSAVYFRCSGYMASDPARGLRQRFSLPSTVVDIPSALQALAGNDPSRRLVLVLDQFERIAHQFPRTAEGRRKLRSYLQSLASTNNLNATVVVVGRAESSYLAALMELRAEVFEVPRFSRAGVRRILQFLTWKGGLSLQGAIIEELVARYADAEDSRREFSLAHINAICRLLVSKPQADVGTYERLLRDRLESLDDAINKHDMVNVIEDLPYRDQRELLRTMLRIVSPRCASEVFEFACNDLWDEPSLTTLTRET